jgi:hypothetical protein
VRRSEAPGDEISSSTSTSEFEKMNVPTFLQTNPQRCFVRTYSEELKLGETAVRESDIIFPISRVVGFTSSSSPKGEAASKTSANIPTSSDPHLPELIPTAN